MSRFSFRPARYQKPTAATTYDIFDAEKGIADGFQIARAYSLKTAQMICASLNGKDANGNLQDDQN